MRGTAAGLATPYPIVSLLPSVLQADPFTARFTAGLDDVLAPAIASIDCLEAYLDPRVAPTDFVDWVATWLGVDIDENWPRDRQRRALLGAIGRHALRGTVAGLRAELELASGGTAEVVDSGGVQWSQTPNADLPGSDHPRVAVRVIVDDPDTTNTTELDALVRAAKPAHVVHRLEVLAT